MDCLVSKQAPDFSAQVVTADGKIENDFTLSSMRGKYVLLVFYPLDFTFVCPSELLALDQLRDEFAARGAETVAVSVDSPYTHLAWRRTPVEKGGIGPVSFPLVSDLKRSIARDFGVLHDDEVALRGLFLIDREGVVRHCVINDLSLGRNMQEALRMIDALQFTEQRGQVCPANWEKGQAGMDPSQEGVVDYLSKFAQKG
jgi:peroxiredoxin (alkyl hydroperoxide reductase subunit C)